jgi:hypothetical protein
MSNGAAPAAAPFRFPWTHNLKAWSSSHPRILHRDGLVSRPIPACGTVGRQRGESRLTFRRLAAFRGGVLVFGFAHQQPRNVYR